MSTKATLTFTPRAKGKIILIVDFDAIVQTGDDWSASGNYVTTRVYLTQSASTTNGTDQKMSTVRGKFALQGIFNVAANASVDCGVEVTAHGLSTGYLENINIRAHLVKETST